MSNVCFKIVDGKVEVLNGPQLESVQGMAVKVVICDGKTQKYVALINGTRFLEGVHLLLEERKNDSKFLPVEGSMYGSTEQPKYYFFPWVPIGAGIILLHYEENGVSRRKIFNKANLKETVDWYKSIQTVQTRIKFVSMTTYPMNEALLKEKPDEDQDEASIIGELNLLL